MKKISKPMFVTLDRSAKLSEHFRAREFACTGESMILIAVELVEELEAIRAYFGDNPVHITSGWRNHFHNAEVGGEYDSQHLLGFAADFWVEGVTPIQVYNYICKRHPTSYGVGLYNSFVHMDIRDKKARWRK